VTIGGHLIPDLSGPKEFPGMALDQSVCSASWGQPFWHGVAAVELFWQKLAIVLRLPSSRKAKRLCLRLKKRDSS